MHFTVCGTKTYSKALEALRTLQSAPPTYGKKLNPREKTLAWIQHLRLDINKVDYVHVAGTKGKGSTCLYLEHLLKEHQAAQCWPKRIGCLTSPHLISVRERYRIDSRPVSEACFAEHFWSLWDRMAMANNHCLASTLQRPGYPGFLTLLGFYIFAREQIDLAIVETGMGGETDSTNIIDAPIATGISEIGLDHTDRLGNTLDAIAWHKGGIFKEKRPAFSVPQREPARSTLLTRAEERGTTVRFVQDDFLAQHNVTVSPDARFQRLNASLAVELARACLREKHQNDDVLATMAKTLRMINLPARFETIERGRITWVLSSSHNAMSIAATCEAFSGLVQSRSPTTVFVCFSHDSERSFPEMLDITYDRLYRTVAHKETIFCPEVLGIEAQYMREPMYSRLKDGNPVEVCNRQAEYWETLSNGGNVRVVASVSAVVRSMRALEGEATVLVLGSTYTAGMFRYLLTKGMGEWQD